MGDEGQREEDEEEGGFGSKKTCFEILICGSGRGLVHTHTQMGKKKYAGKTFEARECSLNL